MVNGFFEIGSIGTLADFFTVLKEKLLEYTDFTLTESTDLSLTFDTKIHSVTLVVTDSKIDDASSTTINNALKFEFFKSTTSVGSFTVIYTSSGVTASTEKARSIKLSAYKNAHGDTFYSFIASGSTTTTFDISYVFSKISSKDILTNTEVSRFGIGNKFYDDSAVSNLTLSNPITSKASGMVMLNSLLTQSSTYTEYVDRLYNCSTVTANMVYKISNKNYFALNTNLLVEE